MTRRNKKLHVFVGRFQSDEQAHLYCQEHWEPEPDHHATDEEYEQWEDRNPQWIFRDELQTRLDSDFVETVFGNSILAYLEGYLIDLDDLESVRKHAVNANTLVLLFPDALRGGNIELTSTSRLVYCGAFDFRW